jgi:hypothetical protein
VDTSKVGKYTITYSVKDSAGNRAEVKRTVIVNEKPNQAPTVDAGSDKSVEVGKSVTLTAAATDPDGTIKSYKWSEGTTTLGTSQTLSYKPTTVGKHVIVLTVTDNKGATATDKVVVTATEAPDRVKPVITLKGASTVNLTVGDTYTDAGATASDNKDGDITDKIVKTGNVDTSKVGKYTVTYSVKDSAGNRAEVKRTVIVNEKPDPYKDYQIAKDNSVRDVIKTFQGYTIKVLTDYALGDMPSNDTIAVYGKINGENTAALLKINSNYPNGTKIVVRAYNADGTVAGTSEVASTNGTSPVNFGSFKTNE